MRKQDITPRFDSEARPDVESYLVGGVLACAEDEPGLLADVLDICPADAVILPGTREIWQAVHGLYAEGQAVNEPAVLDWLLAKYQRGESRDKPDAYFIANVGRGGFSNPVSARHFAERIANMNRRDNMRNLFLTAAADCMRYGEDTDAIASQVRQALDNAVDVHAEVTLGPLLRQVLKDVENGQGAKPMPTPWPSLNRVLKGGAVPGELVVLAGRPGLGKTALAGCWAVETARNIGPVLFVSLEVKDKTLGARLIAREASVDNRAFREGIGKSWHELTKMQRAVEALEDLPLQIVDSSIRITRPSTVRKLARKVKGGVALIVVDYLQLLNADHRNQVREREIADMSRAMKQLALEMPCPVLLLSQLNRKVEEAGREPQMSDLRESGSIEQDADIVIMLHSTKADMCKTLCPVKVLVRKGRSSGTGEANLIFDKAHSDFTEDKRSLEERIMTSPMAANDL